MTFFTKGTDHTQYNKSVTLTKSYYVNHSSKKKFKEANVKYPKR